MSEIEEIVYSILTKIGFTYNWEVIENSEYIQKLYAEILSNQYLITFLNILILGIFIITVFRLRQKIDLDNKTDKIIYCLCILFIVFMGFYLCYKLTSLYYNPNLMVLKSLIFMEGCL